MATKCRVLQSGVCSITQPYHINGQKGYSYDHWGIDITDWNGSYNCLGWVVAHSAGTVIEYRNNCTGFEYNSYGNYVLLKHANGMYTLYGHLAYNTVQVKAGQSVSKGQKLGYMGNTGTSYGGHLHFEVRQSNGYKIDPQPYLNAELPKMANKIWKKQNGYWYLYDRNGNMLKGWQKVNDQWYYLNPSSGVMKVGWLYDNSYKGWFHFDGSGAMQIGWKKIDGRWYYLTKTASGNYSKGEMQKGWSYIDKNWYYLQEKGDKTHKEGEMRTGWYYDENYKGWFLLAPTGEMLTGWQKKNDKWYFLSKKASGSYVKGEMRTGWLSDNGKKYYLSPTQTKEYKEGEMLTGIHEIDGKTYEFGDDGALVKVIE